ncbi:diaminopimelate decarboxylase [Caldimonas brevitalea]|uniref:Diaminopimelate decarboxylase n=1 Tax=Caldimonas brevitalea TaxID=413882 RepID=A0A0G3BR68_9BURK|nr:diaminopimelate decarboxylase [Caldimonas brevitalea]
MEAVTLAGNINEALDVWATDVPLPPVEHGDAVALLNAGGYASSMSSNHCLRGQFRELLLQP